MGSVRSLVAEYIRRGPGHAVARRGPGLRPHAGHPRQPRPAGQPGLGGQGGPVLPLRPGRRAAPDRARGHDGAAGPGRPADARVPRHGRTGPAGLGPGAESSAQLSAPGPLLLTAPRVITGRPERADPGAGLRHPAGGEVTDALGQGPPPGPPDIELDDGVLVPGFVDLQVNGYFGDELQAVEPDGWAEVASRLPRDRDHGRSCRPSSPRPWTSWPRRCGPPPQPDARPAARRPGPRRPPGGPVHLADRARRAQPGLDHRPDPDAIDALLTAGRGLLRLVTLAPERPGALAAIGQLTAARVLVSVGHSDATAARWPRPPTPARGWSPTCSTRQRRSHHREPGVVGQALTDPRLTSGLIVDLHHVTPDRPA